MTADVVQLRDWDWLRPIEGPMRTEPADVVILPVVRCERLIEDVLSGKDPRAGQRLLGDLP